MNFLPFKNEKLNSVGRIKIIFVEANEKTEYRAKGIKQNSDGATGSQERWTTPSEKKFLPFLTAPDKSNS